MYDFLDICSCNHIVLAMPGLPMVFVVPTKTTGRMNGLLPSLGGFSNCVLDTYSWLLHNGQQETLEIVGLVSSFLIICGVQPEISEPEDDSCGIFC
jgi:hypothetical protein